MFVLEIPLWVFVVIWASVASFLAVAITRAQFSLMKGYRWSWPKFAFNTVLFVFLWPIGVPIGFVRVKFWEWKRHREYMKEYRRER